MKKLLLTTLIIASFGATASSTEWLANDTGGYFVNSIQSDDDTFAVIATDWNDTPALYLTIFHPDCADYESKILSMSSIRINGTLVKAQSQCLGKEYMIVWPRTKIGEDYLHSQFKKKNWVKVDYGNFTSTYSAKGFTKAWHSMINDRAI